MAIGVILEFRDATLDQYDEVLAILGFSHEGTGAPQGLFHWVTKTDTGIRVTDVWRSKEAFEQFAQEQIGPATAKVGLPHPPEITFYEVYNYLTAG